MNQAVTILIERMRTHPEDFFGPVGFNDGRLGIRAFTQQVNPKFRSIAQQIEKFIIGSQKMSEADFAPTPLWFLTDEERDALAVAYTDARRTRFVAETIHTMMSKDVSVEQDIQTVAGQAHGFHPASMIGAQP